MKANIEELSNRYPVFKNVQIENSDGSASDEQFIDSLLKGKFVLSNGEEFIHDHTVHLLSYFNLLLLDAKGYRTDEEPVNSYLTRYREAVSGCLEKIKHCRKTPQFLNEKNYRILINLLSQEIDFILSFSRTSFPVGFIPVSTNGESVLKKSTGIDISQEELKRISKELVDMINSKSELSSEDAPVPMEEDL